MQKYSHNRFFTRDHEWVDLHTEVVLIGLTDPALNEMGEIVKIELDSPGDRYSCHQTYGRITSRKYLTKLIMPFNATLLEINLMSIKAVMSEENALSTDWLIKVKRELPFDTSQLLSFNDYKDFKSHNILHMIKYLSLNTKDRKI